MRAQVAERAGPCEPLLEAPDLGVGRAPFLQVAPAEVMDVAEVVGLEHLAREPHRGDEAVVERAHVHDTGRLHPLPDLVRLLAVAAERLLADDVLARLGRRDRRLGVQVVRTAVVEELHLRVGDELAPVRRVALEAVPVRRGRHGLLVAPGDRHEPWHQRRRPGHVRELLVPVRVRLAHERVAEHPNADRRDLGAAVGAPHRRESSLVAHPSHSAFRGLTRVRPRWDRHAPLFCIAASNASSEGEKSVRRTNASASCAPYPRSMPLSSHSIESGPW